MPPREPIRTYVPEQHAQKVGPSREREKIEERHKLPTLIRWFVWLLVLRAVVNLTFALTVGLAPESDAAHFILANFDPWPKAVSAEGLFYATALIYAVMAWRWYSRDWRVRWIVMFASGATAAKLLVNWAGVQAAGDAPPMPPSQSLAFIMAVGINLLICGYLAFYPGVAEAFKETPWD